MKNKINIKCTGPCFYKNGYWGFCSNHGKWVGDVLKKNLKKHLTKNKQIMETTTQKVNVAEIMDRARKKVNSVKKSTEKVQSKSGNFRIVPGLSKYEFNGNILRNVKTKAIIKFKTGRTKYQLECDGGGTKNLSNDELRALLPAEGKEKKEKAPKAAKAPKAPKEPKVKKEKKEGEAREFKYHHVPKPLPLEQLKPDARKIMSFPDKSYNQVMKLHEAGYNKEEIIEITGRRNDVISKYLRPLLKGKK